MGHRAAVPPAPGGLRLPALRSPGARHRLHQPLPALPLVAARRHRPGGPRSAVPGRDGAGGRAARARRDRRATAMRPLWTHLAEPDRVRRRPGRGPRAFRPPATRGGAGASPETPLPRTRQRRLIGSGAPGRPRPPVLELDKSAPEARSKGRGVEFGDEDATSAATASTCSCPAAQAGQRWQAAEAEPIGGRRCAGASGRCGSRT